MSDCKKKSPLGVRSWKMRIFLVWILFPGETWEHRSGNSHPMDSGRAVERLRGTKPAQKATASVTARAQLVSHFSCGQWTATRRDL